MTKWALSQQMIDFDPKLHPQSTNMVPTEVPNPALGVQKSTKMRSQEGFGEGYQKMIDFWSKILPPRAPTCSQKGSKMQLKSIKFWSKKAAMSASCFTNILVVSNLHKNDNVCTKSAGRHLLDFNDFNDTTISLTQDSGGQKFRILKDCNTIVVCATGAPPEYHTNTSIFPQPLPKNTNLRIAHLPRHLPS